MEDNIIYVVTKVEKDGNFSQTFENRDKALAEYYHLVGSFIEKYGSMFHEKSAEYDSVSKKSCMWPGEAGIVLSLGIKK